MVSLGKPDVMILPILTTLADCLCREIVDSGLPGVCFCGPMAGAEPGLFHVDGCAGGDCGMAWVRLTTAFPSKVLPVQSLDSDSCGSPLALQIEIGIVRCFEDLKEDGSFADSAEHFEALSIQMADLQAMRRAILCCMPRKETVLSPYTPIGPEGNLIGGSWSVVVSELAFNGR